MSTPRGTVWPAEPHTLVKHAVYRRYLHRWMPIMVHGWKGSVTYAEGFAGPGTYTGGEEGSPVIALRALIDDPTLRTKAKDMRFLFVEQDVRRAERLKEELARACGPVPLAALGECGIDLEVQAGDCNPELLRIMSAHGAWGRPMLVVLDTWGGGEDLTLMRRIAQNQSGEVIVTFQPQYFTRFADDPSIIHGDTVFGTDEWRTVSDLPAPEKNAWVIARYRQAMREAGFRHILTFELVDTRGASLFLVFGTNHDKGLIKMKEAMWEVDVVGGVRYRDPADPQQGLLDIRLEPDITPLARTLRALLEEQPEHTALVRDLRAWALYNTVFKESQVKPALERLVAEGVITADGPDGSVRLTGSVRLGAHALGRN